jgi:hypothetical protein
LHSRKYERQGTEDKDGGTGDGKQRSKGHKQWNKATKKGTIDRVQRTEDKEDSREDRSRDRTGDKEQSHETGDGGRETRTYT